MKNWLTRLFGGRVQSRSLEYDAWRALGLVRTPSLAGVTVDELAALGIPALSCGIRVISEAVGSLPLILYQRSAASRFRATTHPLYRLLHDAPNPELTRPVFWELMQSWAIQHGYAVAEIEREESGRPLNLWPIHPNHIRPERVGGVLFYRLRTGSIDVLLKAEDVLYVPGLTSDGSAAYSLLEQFRDTLGMAIATTTHGASLFGNSARPGGYLTVPGQLSETGRKNLSTSWDALHGGPHNAGRTGILEDGVTFTVAQHTAEQSQYVEVMAAMVYQVARMLNIQPSKIHSLEKATWGNLETLNQDFLTTTLRPWLIKFECEINRKLLLPDEREEFYAEFLVDGLLRANTTERYATYATGIDKGFLSINECRAMENLPPRPDGDFQPKAEPTPTPVVPSEAEPEETDGTQV